MSTEAPPSDAPISMRDEPTVPLETPQTQASEERRARAFHTGEVLFREGEPARETYLLEEGRVRLIKRVRGAERSVMIARPGDLFGESALLGGEVRTSTAIALSDGVALSMAASEIEAALLRDPGSAARVIEQLVRRLRDAEDQIEIMMLGDNQSKVVSLLLKLARPSQARREGAGTVLSISPMELSTRVGLDVDSVKRVVQKLREGQYVRVSDERLEIPDMDAMRRLSALLDVKDEIRGDL